MKLFRVLFFICLAIIISGCAGYSVVMNEGTYDLTSSISWANIQLTTNFFDCFAFFTDWKDQSDLEFVIQKPDKRMRYGALTMGNNGQVFRFGITRNYNYIDKLYIDLDCDGKIFENEVIELKTYKGQAWSASTFDFYESYIFNLPLYVRYLKADGTTILKKISTYIKFTASAPGSGNGILDQKILMYYQVLTYFKGEVTINNDQEVKKVNFILVDFNHNGIFNEFGKDQFLFDKNNDGKFGFGTEKRPLLELYKIPAQKSQPMQTLRLSLFAYPEKIIVTDANSNPPEPVLFEPVGDDD